MTAREPRVWASVRRVDWPDRHVWAAMVWADDGRTCLHDTTLWPSWRGALNAAVARRADHERQVRKDVARRVTQAALDRLFEIDHEEREQTA